MTIQSLSDKDILKACLIRAQKNGYILPRGLDKAKIDLEYLVEYVPQETFIFDHDFAKALFGKKLAKEEGYLYLENFNFPIWKYHLEKLAIAKDRIQYLRKWLEQNPEQDIPSQNKHKFIS